MQLKPIGYIKSPIKQPKFGGWQDLITEIVVDTGYLDGLEGIDGYSHLIILYWLDKVDKVKLKIPSGSQTGQVFRLKSKGITHLQGHGRGDEFVNLKVVTPDSLTAQQRKLFEELAKTLDSPGSRK